MNNMSYEDGYKQIWKSLNETRRYIYVYTPTFISFDFLLYIIHAHTSGLLKEFSEDRIFSFSIQNALFGGERNYPHYELSLFEYYKDILDDPHNQKPLFSFYRSLQIIDEEWYNEYKAKLFDDIIEDSISNSNKYGEFFQPIELTRFIASVCKYDGNGILYNPFAGSATYCTELAGEGLFFGQELNPRTWAIGIMRLLAHEKNAFNYTCQDSIKDWAQFYSDKTYNNCLFDCIVATPPFGMTLNSNNITPNNYYHRTEDFFIDRCLRSLSPKGIAITVLPQNVAYREGLSKQLRKEFILNDKLDTVILLPQGAFTYTTISAVILLFSNHKKDPGYVRMVKGSEFFISTEKTKRINYSGLLDAIENSTPDYVKRISNEEIINNDFNILPTTYFIREEKLPEGFIKYMLSDITEEYNGVRCTPDETTGKVVKINMLSDNPFRNTLEYDTIPEDGLSTQYRKITADVLLLSKIRILKPTFVHASEEKPIYINSNILALRVTSPAIDINCLILVLSQKTDLRVGIYVPNINLSFLRNLEIAMPGPLTAQEAYFLTAMQSYKMAQVKEFGLEEIAASQKKDFIAVLRRRKHDINTYVGDIRNRIQGLNKFLIRENLDQMTYSTRQNTTVGKNLETIIHKLNLMGQYIEHIADENNFGIPQKVDLCKKLKEINDGPNYKVELILDESTLSLVEPEDNEETHAFVNIAPLDLDHVFLNIIANASKHGFVNPDAMDYCMEIYLIYEQKEDMYNIVFRNNGLPFPEGMTTERYGTLGEKAGLTQGNGEGGAIVKDTIEHYGGKISILNEPDGLFPVTIILRLPRYEGD